MNEEQLLVALTHTLSPEETLRREAEKFLAKSAPQNGFVGALLKIVVLENVPPYVQTAAAVQLKNIVRLNWQLDEESMKSIKDKSMRYKGNVARFVIPENDKVLIRENIVEAMARATDRGAAKALGETVKNMCSADFPGRWSEVVGMALKQIMTQEPSRMHAGLVVFDKLSTTLKHKIDVSDRIPLEEFVGATFPILRELMESLLNQNVNEMYAAELFKRMGKIFEKIVYHGVPSVLFDEANARAWMLIFVRILEKDIPEQILPVGSDERRNFPWWKAKRRAAAAVDIVFARYAFASSVKENYRSFCTTVTKPNGLAQSICVPMCLAQLRKAFIDKRYCSDQVIRHLFRILGDAIRFSHMFKDLKSELGWIIASVLIPAQKWTEEQLNDWSADPHALLFEIYNMNYDVMFSGASPISDAAAMTLEMFCRFRKRYALPIALEVINNSFMKHRENPNDLNAALEKSTAVAAMTSIAHILRVDPSINSQHLLYEFIFPDMQSQYPFLRFNACRCASKFVKSEWSSNPTVATALVQNVLRLLGDSDVLVQTEASCAVNIVIRKGKEGMHQAVLNELSFAVQRLLALAQEIPVENIFYAIKALIANYPSQLLRFAKELSVQLTESFFRIATETEEDDDINAMSAASSCLESLELLISALSLEENNQGENPIGRQMLMEVTPVVLPLLNLIFAVGGCEGFDQDSQLDRMAIAAANSLFPNGAPPQMKLDFVDYFESALLIMHMISYHMKGAPEAFWRYVPILIRFCAETNDTGTTKKVMNNIETMVHYDPQGFASSIIPGINLQQMVIEFALKNVKEFVKAAFALEAKFKGSDNEDDEDDGDFADEEDHHKPHHDEDGDIDFEDEGVDEEYNEIASFATFLLCTIFQVGGSLDSFVKPVVDECVKALNAPIAEPSTMVEFLTVIMSCIFYNPTLTVSALGEKNAGFFMEIVIDYIDEFFILPEKMAAILSMSKLLALPPSAVPRSLNEHRTTMISCLSNLVTGLERLRTELKSLKDASDKALQEEMASGKRPQLHDTHAVDFLDDKESLPEAMNPGPTDVPEDKDVGDEDDNEGQHNFADMSEDQRFKFMAEEEVEDDEDLDEQEDAVSPIDDIDELVFLVELMQNAPQEARNAFEESMKELKSEDEGGHSIVTQMLAEGQRRLASR